MLLTFSVENFRSIKERQTLSLEATKDDQLESSNVVSSDHVRLLKSATIYGPNASGKSNLLEAIGRMRQIILTSSRETQVHEHLPTEPFLLSEETAAAPSVFEVEFLWKESRYRYGFLVDAEKVREEWLFRRRGKAKEARLFTREEQDIDANPEQFKEGVERKQFARPNALFLSVCAQLNGPIAAEVFGWFRQLRYVSGISDRGMFTYTARQLQNPETQKKYEEFACRAQFDLVGLRSEVSEQDIDPTSSSLEEPRRPRTVVRTEIKTLHRSYDKDGQVAGTVEFDLQKQGSQGSKKFIALTGPLFDAVEEGRILLIDEFEARLHPLLTRAIFEWFHSQANRSNAQLIVATHDVGLMDPEVLRRDQVWFCDKNDRGATNVYCLAEFDSNTVRPTTKFNKQYLLGLLGAVPKLALTKEKVGA